MVETPTFLQKKVSRASPFSVTTTELDMKAYLMERFGYVGRRWDIILNGSEMMRDLKLLIFVYECLARRSCERHWRRCLDEKDNFDLFNEFKSKRTFTQFILRPL